MPLVDDLLTPALLVDRTRLEANIRRMQEVAVREDVALRPHVKTHKAPKIARMQREAGASGLTVATVSEAERFADAGFEDLRIAGPVVSAEKHERLAALPDRIRRSLTVDGDDGLRAASAHHRDRPIDVLIEVDTGHHRCGIRWDRGREIVRLAELALELPGVRFSGILTHAGHAYEGPDEGEDPGDALTRVADQERDRMLEVAALLRETDVLGAGGIREFEISVGSTPTASRFENRELDGFTVTEIRPGNYVFNDGMQVALGSAPLDACALTVLATVVSARRDGPRERVVLDAGKKILTTDRGYGTDGYGTVLYNAATMRPHPHARIDRLSEEHAWVEVPGGSTLHVGDPVRILPHHACVSAATQDILFLVDEEERITPLPVEARAHRPLA